MDTIDQQLTSVGPIKLTDAELDLVAGGNNANSSPGNGIETAASTFNYQNNSGHPGSPTPPGYNSSLVGPTHANERSGQNPGYGTLTH